MLPRLWCFAAGLPLGALLAVAGGAPSLTHAAAAAAAGGLALALAATIVAGRAGADAAAAAAGLGWAAAPALGAALLGLAPGPTGLAVACTVVTAAALFSALRRPPPLGEAPLTGAVLGLVAGGVGLVAASGAVAALGATQPALGERTAAAIYDLDAQVKTRPLPRCAPEPARIEVLLDQGAHPALSPADSRIWFDAADEDGRRQIHSLDPETGEVVCWTCGEPGNNQRPSPGHGGYRLVFDSDRFASWRAPTETELSLLSITRGRVRRPSRRLTFEPGPDDHAIFGPGDASLVWSRGRGGRFDVVSAGFRSGHGALMLARPSLVAAGGAAWVAPLGWSADARALALGRGGLEGAIRGELLDPATGRLSALAATRGVAFSADGGRTAVVAPAAGASAPGWLGFAAVPLARALGLSGPMGRGTVLATGDTGAELAPVALGAAGDWGAPSGVALASDGASVVVGQQRRSDGRVEERLVRVTLACEFGVR